MDTNLQFFASVISAGALLTGFCGTFLAFRIQREASYHRQPALSYESGEAKDIFINLTHFTSPLFLLCLATLCAMIFGFVLPLLALGGFALALALGNVVVGGLLAATTLLVGYFVDELFHYRVFGRSLRDNLGEWGKEWPIVAATIAVAVLAWLAATLGL